MGLDCLIVGLLLLLREFNCWVNIIVGSAWLLGYYYCWESMIVGLYLAKVTMVTIAYCLGKRTIKGLLPLGREDL
jgi:hypothetical protein